jgi:hypothetical protein
MNWGKTMRMKKLLPLLSAAALCLSAAFTGAAAHTFEDVPDGHWAFNEIQFFYNAGIVAGGGENTFAPDENVTREQFAKLLAAVFSKEDYQPDAQTFSDVTPDRWSYRYVEAVKPYLTGYEPAGARPFFNPSARAGREDVAYALVKITGLSAPEPKDEAALNAFSDADEVSPALRAYVGAAVGNGLIRGHADGTFRPQSGITRAETVVMLLCALKAPVSAAETPAPAETAATPSPEPDAGIPAPPTNYKYSLQTDGAERIAGWGVGSFTIQNAQITLKWTPETKDVYFRVDASVSNLKAAEPAYLKWTAYLTEVSACGDAEIVGTVKTVFDEMGKVWENEYLCTFEIADGTLRITHPAAFEGSTQAFITANVNEVTFGEGYDGKDAPDFLRHRTIENSFE